MNTRFNVRKKVLGNLTPVRLAAKNGKTVKGTPSEPRPGKPKSRKRTARISPPTTTAPIALDTRIFGQTGIMAAHLLPGSKPALIDTGPANTAENVIEALAELGITRLDSIILTHAHYDHAGGAGRIAEHFPEATIYAHKSATRYLTDPSLLAGSVEIWDGKAEELFGSPTAIPVRRVRGLSDGDTVDLGGRRLQAIETPGHTRSHMVFLDLETDAMICGDALGIQLPGSRIIRPSTPPSDCTHKEAIASIQKMRSYTPASVHLAHFGESRQPPEETFDRAILAINDWHQSFIKKSELAESEEELLRSVNACVEATLEPVPPSVRRGFEAINPAWLNIAGMANERKHRPDDFADAV